MIKIDNMDISIGWVSINIEFHGKNTKETCPLWNQICIHKNVKDCAEIDANSISYWFDFLIICPTSNLTVVGATEFFVRGPISKIIASIKTSNDIHSLHMFLLDISHVYNNYRSSGTKENATEQIVKNVIHEINDFPEAYFLANNVAHNIIQNTVWSLQDKFGLERMQLLT